MFGNIFIAAALFFFFGVSWPQISKYLSLVSWKKTSCLIVSSEVQREHVSARDTGKGAMFSPQIEYQFRAGGKRINSSGYRPFQTTGPHRKAQEIVSAHPAGMTVDCYYNPKNPNDSVLDRSLDAAGVLLSFVPVLFLGFGFLLRFLARGVENGKIETN